MFFMTLVYHLQWLELWHQFGQGLRWGLILELHWSVWIYANLERDEKIKKKNWWATIPYQVGQGNVAFCIFWLKPQASLMCNRPIMCFWATLAKLWMKPKIWCYTHFLVCIGCMMIRKVLEICLIEVGVAHYLAIEKMLEPKIFIIII